MLQPMLQKDDKKANILIWVLSFVVFIAVVFLTNVKLFEHVDLGFDVHIFAKINAIINSVVSILLITALIAVKQKNYIAHKKIMLLAIICSTLFLVSYIAHHLLAGETKYGGEKDALYFVYIFILITHIVLATIILPFILFTAYRGLTNEFAKHKKLARYTWPLWLYVSITGVLVYMLISPYYH